jgi:uncharacterized membrane protein YgcG
MRYFLAALLAAAFLLLGIPTSASADVDDFTFDSFAADYYLGADESGHSTLRTVETLVARFPETDQNRGIRRSLVEDYDGHPTDLSLVSVTDETGAARDYETESEDGLLHVTIAADDYVHGAQTYVITYEQNNVTRFFSDTGVDEFYWDTNGTGWAQPFGSVTGRLHVDPAIADRLTGDMACYSGIELSTETCPISDSGGVITASDTDLGPFQNVTMAVAFEPGTFVPRDDSYFANGLSWVQLIALLGGIAMGIWGLVIRATRTRDADGRPTIVAEYGPPKDADLFTAADLIGRMPKAVAATLIDLAVKRRIRIIENIKPWAKDTFSIELVDADGVTGHSARLLSAFFGTRLRPGENYELTGHDTKLGSRISTLQSAVHKDVVKVGLRRTVGTIDVIGPFILVIFAAAIVLVTGIIITADSRGGAIPLLLLIPAGLAVLVVSLAVFRRPLTAAGAEMRDHLKGMQLYIRVAERDRLRFLQSPEGAERTPIDVNDRREMLKLNERMLPYAVLFGLEKDWAEELSTQYDGAQPDWYVSSRPFNAGIFAAGVSSLSSSISASTASSTSGGSSGGGSSGGGGGGGGGGGV